MVAGQTTPVLWIGPADVRPGEQDARLVLSCQHGQTTMLVLCGAILTGDRKAEAIRATMDMHQAQHQDCRCLDGKGMPTTTINLN